MIIIFTSTLYHSQCNLIQNTIPDTLIIAQGDSVNLNVNLNVPSAFSAYNKNTRNIPDGSGVTFRDPITVSGLPIIDTIIHSSAPV